MKYDGMSKPRWKTLMISKDAIHVQVKKGGKDDNVEGIDTSKAGDHMCAMHDAY
jgi:hypothetical protein